MLHVYFVSLPISTFSSSVDAAAAAAAAAAVSIVNVECKATAKKVIK